MKYTPRQPKSNVNVSPRSPLRDFFVLTAGLAGMVVALYILLGIAVDLLAPRMSMDLEKKMGGLFFLEKSARDADSDRQQYLQSLLDTLQGQLPLYP